MDEKQVYENQETAIKLLNENVELKKNIKKLEKCCIQQFKEEKKLYNHTRYIMNDWFKVIDDTYEEICERKSGDSYIYDYNGKLITTDIGYAFDGIDFFIKELKHKIKDKHILNKGDKNE